MPDARKPDAVIYPIGMFPGGAAGVLAAKKTFGPVLGSNYVAVANQETFNFARATVHHTVPTETPGLLFPEGHPWAKQERYHWFLGVPDGRGGWSVGDECTDHTDHPDMPKLGFLKDDPYKDDAAVMVAIHGSLARRIAERQRAIAERDTPEEQARRAEMKVERLRELGIVPDPADGVRVTHD